jgi:hypothetical protein
MAKGKGGSSGGKSAGTSGGKSAGTSSGKTVGSSGMNTASGQRGVAPNGQYNYRKEYGGMSTPTYDQVRSDAAQQSATDYSRYLEARGSEQRFAQGRQQSQQMHERHMTAMQNKTPSRVADWQASLGTVRRSGGGVPNRFKRTESLPGIADYAKADLQAAPQKALIAAQGRVDRKLASQNNKAQLNMLMRTNGHNTREAAADRLHQSSMAAADRANQLEIARTSASAQVLGGLMNNLSASINSNYRYW